MSVIVRNLVIGLYWAVIEMFFHLPQGDLVGKLIFHRILTAHHSTVQFTRRRLYGQHQEQQKAAEQNRYFAECHFSKWAMPNCVCQ